MEVPALEVRRFISPARLSLSAPTSWTDKAIATGPFSPRTAAHVWMREVVVRAARAALAPNTSTRWL